MPRTTQPHEVINGEVIMSPAPSFDHQWLLGELYSALKDHVRLNRLGVVIAAPLDIIVRRGPKLQTRQPDITYLNSEKTGIHTRRDAQKMPAIEVAPDLVVELLSPDERRHSLAGKLDDYASLGVLEAWLVSPEAEAIEVLVLQGGSYVRSGIFGRGDTVASRVLPGLDLAVDSIFE